MKAILRSNRNITVDIDPNWVRFTMDSTGSVTKYFRDKNTGKTYNESQLDWVEYYGG